MNTNSINYTKFEAVAQRVWATSDLASKKAIIVDEMIAKFAFPTKAAKFRADVAAASTGSKLDKLAADLVLLQSGDRVVKIK